MLARAVLLCLGPFLATSQCPGLHRGTPLTDYVAGPSLPEYAKALTALDLDGVFADLQTLFTSSQDCWPADYGNYGPLFIRLAWHCSGTYRISDGKGGCGGGRQRFEPERSWDDNTNLDKARALLWPVKEKYGDGLSWGDLFILAGTTAIKTMGGPVSHLCLGRLDSPDGTESLDLGPSTQQGEYAPCPVNGKCESPLGSTTVGLIYLNPEGPVELQDGNWVPNPDPAKSAVNIRDAFGRMGMNDSQTVALIGGGHAFGKTHGACPKGPGQSPRENISYPWMGNCGTGKGADAFTSGFEGPWTTNPTNWDNEYFVVLKNSTWEKQIGPGGHYQWQIQDAVGPLSTIMRLTSDVALLYDERYFAIVEDFAENPANFDAAFEEAWFKLTSSGGMWSEAKRCVDVKSMPPVQLRRARMRADDLIV